jgi:hypothetical protein
MIENLKALGSVHIVVKDLNGAVKDERTVDNLVVDTGLAFIASRMKDATATAMTHMAVGTGTTSPTGSDTDLVALAGSREALDHTTVTGSQIEYICGFESSESTGTITEAGIFNAASGGTMLCRVVFSAIEKGADDSLSINWKITLSAS